MEKISIDDANNAIKGIVEGMVFVLQRNKMPLDLDPSKIDINGNIAYPITSGSNTFKHTNNDSNIVYNVHYEFTSDDDDLIGNEINAMCGIRLFMYHPSIVSSDNPHMRVYSSTHKDIKNYIQEINMTVTHLCDNSCRNMTYDYVCDYSNIIKCEINCESVMHNASVDDLVEMIGNNIYDNRSQICLSLTNHGYIVDELKKNDYNDKL